jgi:hypothetical protein
MDVEFRDMEGKLDNWSTLNQQVILSILQV